MAYTTRVHRLLRIIAMIQSEQGWTPKRLAEELKTSDRNVYRDLQQLKAAGIPNREALDRCCAMMSHLMPVVLLVIMDHGAEEDWGVPCYPPQP
jgi:predicted DNA-binding transcriptional regulator YafY